VGERGGTQSIPEFREPIDSVFAANEKAVAADAISKLISDPNRPTVLFNSMIDPLIHFRIKGVIWYQGEANAMDNRSAHTADCSRL